MDHLMTIENMAAILIASVLKSNMCKKNYDRTKEGTTFCYILEV
jgi:hypothetical protein